MKKIITPLISIIAITLTIVFLDPITDKLSSLISKMPEVIVKSSNDYSKNTSYLYVQHTDYFTPYS